jgi:hypothetical protein
MNNHDVLDEAYERLRVTGPEFGGWLSNHGPMAADALLRLGRGDDVHRWVAGYERRLQPAPEPRWPITETDWRDLLGDPSRLGDWLKFFTLLVHEEPWDQVLTRWWPRLLPGAVASATHGLIRSGHVVRALLEQVTTARLDELGQALGYWAARWQPVPGYQPASGDQPVGPALDALPQVAMEGDWGMRARLVQLGQAPSWRTALTSHRPPQTAADVPTALDALTDAAVTRYQRWAHGDPVMLVHAATAPRAARLILPALPTDLWRPTYDTAWAISAAITVAYRPDRPSPAPAADPDTAEDLSVEGLADRAATNRDEHVIKFVEVATESHRRGNPTALAAGTRAAALIVPSW